MARITIELKDDLDRRLRMKVAEKYGGKKGALGKAIAEAVELWLKQNE
jgi:predicted transcriptional regulator